MKNATDKLQARKAERQMDVEEQINSIEDQKKEQKFVFQIISHLDGRRSEPFVTSWDALYSTFHDNQNEPDFPADDWLLLVSVLDGENTTIPATPIIKISSFMNLANTTPNAPQEAI